MMTIAELQVALNTLAADLVRMIIKLDDRVKALENGKAEKKPVALHWSDMPR